MANTWFRFKQFTVEQDHCAMKVTTDACLFGAWVAGELQKAGTRDGDILDVGAGTGLLSLMLAQAGNFTIDAIEKDPAAAAQAAANCGASPWPGRIHVTCGDALTHRFEKNYDVVICNPPFYQNELKSGNDRKNMAHHDAGLTLEELLPVLKNCLRPGGHYFLLLPFKRKEEIKTLVEKAGLGMEMICLVRQSVKHDYFRLMLSGTAGPRNDEMIRFDEISITDEQQGYTSRFRQLLGEYYLNL